MANNRVTPFVKRMRATGGTIYTFSSAVEDIGLNINERNNVVKISHFALLNIPNIAEASTGTIFNTFNIRNIVGCWEYEQGTTSIKDGRVLIAESFQNYALNLEANLLNQETYNPELSNTVSERVFWKWLKETGAIRWADPSIAGNGVRYWTEEVDSSDYSRVVQYIGPVSAGNVRVDTFGTYNETYVLVPTSHGQTRAYFKQVEDDNYRHGMEIGDLGKNILGRESYTRPHPDGLSYLAYYDFVDSSTQVGPEPYYMEYDDSTGTYPGWWYSAEGKDPISAKNAYLTDSSNYINSGVYNTVLRYTGPNTIDFKRSKVDCINLEFGIDNLRTIFGDSTLTFDTLATTHAVNDRFNFNAVLIYYSIYNSTRDAILATNLLGVMFLDAPSGNSSQIVEGYEGILLPSLEKIQSGPTGFGTSYSLRLNIKTDNMIDDTGAIVVDAATSDQIMADQWQAAFQNLSSAVSILTQQNSTLNYISGQYVLLQGQQTQLMNDVTALKYQVNDIARDITGTAGTVAIFADGDDPLVDSSIYMNNGKIGFFNNNPTWPVQIDASLKVKDIYLEKAIRDVSGNILLSYGSPLQIGSSTGGREIVFYSGQGTPAFTIDQSSNVTFISTVQFDGSILDSNGQELAIEDVISEASLGPQFYWQDGSLMVNVDVSGVYATTDYVDERDASLYAIILDVDASVENLYSTAGNTYSKIYIDGSLVTLENGLADVSARPLPDVTKSYVNIQDNSIISYVNLRPLPDVSLAYVNMQDSSILSYADDRMDGIDDAILYLDINKADASYAEAAIDYLEASIGLKAPVDQPTFTTSFGLGLWKFTLDGSNLFLSFNDSSVGFTFTPDGSII